MSEKEALSRIFLGRYTFPNIPSVDLVPRLNELGAKVLVEPSLSIREENSVIGVYPESQESQIVELLHATKASVSTGPRPSWIQIDTSKGPNKREDLARRVQRNLKSS